MVHWLMRRERNTTSRDKASSKDTQMTVSTSKLTALSKHGRISEATNTAIKEILIKRHLRHAEGVCVPVNVLC